MTNVKSMFLNKIKYAQQLSPKLYKTTTLVWLDRYEPTSNSLNDVLFYNTNYTGSSQMGVDSGKKFAVAGKLESSKESMPLYVILCQNNNYWIPYYINPATYDRLMNNSVLLGDMPLTGNDKYHR